MSMYNMWTIINILSIGTIVVAIIRVAKIVRHLEQDVESIKKELKR
ncbi:hypothetical protein GF336_07790 [Candidatus Woesearchaeota archaeon]|nr:hypothetical protein [Candidatus Woesearchaeota archaeon]